MPCGRRPSIASLAGFGARKAHGIVMVTLRTVQPARVAMLSAFARGSTMSSLSQRRPREIDDMRRALFSERIARVSCGGTDPSTRIPRRRLDGVLCHGTFRILRLRDRLKPLFFALVSSITN